MLQIHRKTTKILYCFLTKAIFSFFPAPTVRQWVRQRTVSISCSALWFGTDLSTKRRESGAGSTPWMDSLPLPWYQLSTTTASWVAYWKNSASWEANPQKQFPLPFLTTKPLGTALINRPLPSVALVVAWSKRSGSITGHSCFALAIKGKVASFKRAKWGSAIHTHTFRWQASLLTAPKPDIVLARVHEMDPMTTLHLNTMHSLTPGFLCPPEALFFSKPVKSLSEVKMSGQIHP